MVRLNVRTDKWQIVATQQQKELLRKTVSEFRRLVRCLVAVVNTHWSKLYGVKHIVFEHLKGWRPRGGKKKSTLKQRFHNWLHRRIVNLTEMKWFELGGRVVFVNPRGTSSYAYDGSGKLKRSSSNYELAVFASGKQYNCDYIE